MTAINPRVTTDRKVNSHFARSKSELHPLTSARNNGHVSQSRSQSATQSGPEEEVLGHFFFPLSKQRFGWLLEGNAVATSTRGGKKKAKYPILGVATRSLLTGIMGIWLRIKSIKVRRLAEEVGLGSGGAVPINASIRGRSAAPGEWLLTGAPPSGGWRPETLEMCA